MPPYFFHDFCYTTKRPTDSEMPLTLLEKCLPPYVLNGFLPLIKCQVGNERTPESACPPYFFHVFCYTPKWPTIWEMPLRLPEKYLRSYVSNVFWVFNAIPKVIMERHRKVLARWQPEPTTNSWVTTRTCDELLGRQPEPTTTPG